MAHNKRHSVAGSLFSAARERTTAGSERKVSSRISTGKGSDLWRLKRTASSTNRCLRTLSREKNMRRAHSPQRIMSPRPDHMVATSIGDARQRHDKSMPLWL